MIPSNKGSGTTDSVDDAGGTKNYATLANENDEIAMESKDFNVAELSYLLAEEKWANILKPPHEKLAETLIELGYSRPSKIQRTTIPLLIFQKNLLVVAQAQNGSGKTLSFLVPSIAKVDVTKSNKTAKGLSPQVIIVEQQREVATQVYRICDDIKKKYNDKIELSSLAADTPESGHIVIATPIKIEEFIKNKDNSLADLKLFAVDEADQVLSNETGTRIIGALLNKLKNNNECTLAFISATFPPFIKEFIDKKVTGRPKIEFAPQKIEDLNLRNIQQFYYNGTNKTKIISELLLELPGYQIIVFVNSRAKAKELYDHLNAESFSVGMVVGQEMKPVEREKVITDFRGGKFTILITTNLLSRGFDERTIGLVINLDIPIRYEDKEKADTETYLHRIGRTGRFGDRGIALNVIQNVNEMRLLDQVRQTYGCEIKEVKHEDFKNLGKMLEQVKTQNKVIREKIKETAQ
jgi:ATP-dependent RNA helicase DDX19/DBP5